MIKTRIVGLTEELLEVHLTPRRETRHRLFTDVAESRFMRVLYDEPLR